MTRAVIVAGTIAELTAWWLVARGRSVWTTLVPVLAAIGVAAVIVGDPSWSAELAPAAAAAIGLVAGAALYGATRLALLVLLRSDTFADDMAHLYARQRPDPRALGLVISIVVTAPGEELFWRGLVQPEVGTAFGGGAALGAVLAWLTYVAANLPSRNLAIVAGAIVGGAVWSALAWWTGGVGASVCSHAVWTGLMIGFPAPRATVERR